MPSLKHSPFNSSLPHSIYFKLFDNMADPAMLFKNEQIISCNDACLKQFRYSEKAIFLGLFPCDISPEFQADGRSSKEKAQAMIAIAQQQGHHRFDWLYQCYDGELFTAEVSLTSLYVDDELFILSAIRDISERKKTEKALQESELRWKFALEGAGDGVWDWDIKTDHAVYSTRWKEMLGYTEEDIQPTNQEWQKRIHPDDQASVASTMQAYLAGSISIYRVEYRLKCKDGSYKWILGRGMVVSRDQQGLPLRMIGTHTDITTLKEAELILQKHKEAAELDVKVKTLALVNQTQNMQENVSQQVAQLTEKLKNSTTKAEEAVQLKSQFLSNMSHEIRTPINAILSIAFLTLQTDLTAQQQNYLSKIDSSAKWLIGILDDILNFSKLEAGKVELEYHQFELNSVISMLKTVATPLLADKKVYLSFEVESSIPSVLIGDSLRLGQILLNLISNAIKFTHTGSVTLRVQLLSLVAEQACLNFSVTDTGIGLDMNHKNKLFDAFNQADNSTTRLYGGTGLGLSISKQLVQAMGGQISVESQENVGSCFSFMITLNAKLDTIVTAFPKTSLKHEVKFPGLLNARVLVVEDNLILQEIMPDILGQEGMLVDLANNGLEALALLDDNDYAAVLMDCQMPIMDGFEATKRIRANPRFNTLPIIAMTGNVDNNDHQRCLDFGMNGFISKPVDWEQAFLTLDHWINNCRSGS
jgi:PAS domain S-box-containing protein